MTDRGICLTAGANPLALYSRLRAARLPGVAEIVPGDGMVLLVLEPGASVPAGLQNILLDVDTQAGEATGRAHRIPVRLDGEDLHEIAERSGHTQQTLAELLYSLRLQVKFLGFQPGFAYLDGLPPELHLPRRASPRKRVPAGSVALGGGYCGIYPAAGPGGWHLVGTTDIRLFDPASEPPARFQPGDFVNLVRP